MNVKLHRARTESPRYLIDGTPFRVCRETRWTKGADQYRWYIESASNPWHAGAFLHRHKLTGVRFATRKEAVATLMALLAVEPKPPAAPQVRSLLPNGDGTYRDRSGHFTVRREAHANPYGPGELKVWAVRARSDEAERLLPSELTGRSRFEAASLWDAARLIATEVLPLLRELTRDER